MKKIFFISTIALATLLVSCNNTQTAQESKQTPEASKEAETIAGIEDIELSNTLSLEGNDQMKFDQTLFRVKAGEPVELTFKNVGTMSKESMGHNVVIVLPTVDLDTFGAEAASARADEYIPKTSLSSIVAHSKLLGPGESDKITFTLEKGVYPFICSFPGHYGMMRGKIVAE